MTSCRRQLADEPRAARPCTGAAGAGFRLAWKLVWLAFLLAAIAPPMRAADAESRAFNSAAKAFQDGFAGRAEKEFAEFVQKFPSSLRVPDAILLQARASLARKDATNAVDLLAANLFRAGQLADQYRFWLGQTRLESGDYRAAATDFAQLLNDYPASARRLEASYGEAQARFKLQEWARVAELLQKPDGAFQQAARAGEIGRASCRERVSSPV